MFLLNIRDVIIPEYFDNQAHQWLVETIIKYFDKYHATPTLDTLHIEVKKIDNDVLKTSVVEQLKEAYKASNEDQDYVFITNTQKIALYDSTETLTRFNVGLVSSAYRPIKGQVWVKLVDYDTMYEVRVELDDGDIIIGHYLTPSLTDSSGNTNVVSSEDIAARLVNWTETITGSTSIGSSTITSVSATDIKRVFPDELVTGTGIPANTFVGTVGASSFTLVNEAGAAVNATANGSTTITLGDGLDNTDINNKLTFEVQGSQILIGLASSSRYIKSLTATDARGNSLMSGFTDRVSAITELPPLDWEGYTVKVAPDGSADQSSYYLTFDAQNTTTDGVFGKGTWVEEGAPGSRGVLSAATMPHAFIY